MRHNEKDIIVRSQIQVSVWGRSAEYFLYLLFLGEMHLMAQCSKQHLLCPDNVSLVYEISFVVLI